MTRYNPQALADLVEREANPIESIAFLTKSSNKRLREMWCAARFGLGYERNHGQCEIEISEEDEYREFDFHLCVSNDKLPFQLAEVMDEGRRRGDEYLNRTSEEVNQIHNERPWQDEAYAGGRVCETLRSKMKKYQAATANSVHMLLYLNIKASSVAWVNLARTAEHESKNFASVWVITQDLICCIYGGNRWFGKVGWKQIENAV